MMEEAAANITFPPSLPDFNPTEKRFLPLRNDLLSLSLSNPHRELSVRLTNRPYLSRVGPFSLKVNDESESIICCQFKSAAFVVH